MRGRIEIGPRLRTSVEKMPQHPTSTSTWIRMRWQGGWRWSHSCCASVVVSQSKRISVAIANPRDTPQYFGLIVIVNLYQGCLYHSRRFVFTRSLRRDERFRFSFNLCVWTSRIIASLQLPFRLPLDVPPSPPGVPGYPLARSARSDSLHSLAALAPPPPV